MTFYGVAILLVVFSALLALFDGILLIATKALLKRLALLAPAQRANAILMCRFAPAGLSLLLLLGVFLPSWLRYEPANTGETASNLLTAVACLSLLPLLQGFHRGSRMFLRTRERLQRWRRHGRSAPMTAARFEVLEVKSQDLTLCVGGYLTPTIYASADLLSSLEPAEFSAALQHEVSHASARDPLRLLWMASCPDFLQLFGLDRSWRTAFSRACEFAADADAHRGRPEVALDLASALLKVARLSAVRSLAADTLADVAVSSAFLSRADLEARVHALASPAGAPSVVPSVARPWMFVAIALLLCGAGAIVSPQVHELTEEVGRLFAS
jgi:Peptidase family M48